MVSDRPQDHRLTAGTSDPVPRSLAWIVPILWGGDAEGATVAHPFSARWDSNPDLYAVLPSLRRPRLLVPTASREAAAAAVEHYPAGTARSDLLARLLRHGIRGRGAGYFIRSGLVRSQGAGTTSDFDLRATLGKQLNEPSVLLSVTFDAQRSHRKPAVRIMTTGGRLLAFCKVAWNSLTTKLAFVEWDTLQELSRITPPYIHTPRPIAFRPLGGLTILLTAPLDAPTPARPFDREFPSTLLADLMQFTQPSNSRFDESPFLANLRSRVAGVAPGGMDGGLSAHLDNLARTFGAAPISYGFGHGDFVPWNLATRDREAWVWDWEHSRTDAPFGLDAAHYILLTQLFRRGRRLAAVKEARTQVESVLPSIGVPSGLASPLLALSIFELALRIEEARSDGVQTSITFYRDILSHVI